MHASVHIGVGRLVVVGNGVEYYLGFLARRRAVEIDKLVSLWVVGENGEVLADGLWVEHLGVL